MEVNITSLAPAIPGLLSRRCGSGWREIPLEVGRQAKMPVNADRLNARRRAKRRETPEKSERWGRARPGTGSRNRPDWKENPQIRFSRVRDIGFSKLRNTRCSDAHIARQQPHGHGRLRRGFPPWLSPPPLPSFRPSYVRRRPLYCRGPWAVGPEHLLMALSVGFGPACLRLSVCVCVFVDVINPSIFLWQQTLPWR